MVLNVQESGGHSCCKRRKGLGGNQNVKMIFSLALTNCSGFVTEIDGQSPKILVICIFKKT